MSKRIIIRVLRDGRVEAVVEGATGVKCTDYIPVLEQLLDAEVVASAYTPEFYVQEESEGVKTQQSGSNLTNTRIDGDTP